jgi:hypothetical protein
MLQISVVLAPCGLQMSSTRVVMSQADFSDVNFKLAVLSLPHPGDGLGASFVLQAKRGSSEARLETNILSTALINLIYCISGPFFGFHFTFFMVVSSRGL